MHVFPTCAVYQSCICPVRLAAAHWKQAPSAHPWTPPPRPAHKHPPNYDLTVTATITHCRMCINTPTYAAVPALSTSAASAQCFLKKRGVQARLRPSWVKYRVMGSARPPLPAPRKTSIRHSHRTSGLSQGYRKALSSTREPSGSQEGARPTNTATLEGAVKAVAGGQVHRDGQHATTHACRQQMELKQVPSVQPQPQHSNLVPAPPPSL